MTAIKCIEPEHGGMLRRAISVRICRLCGKRVNPYKSPRSIVTLCYACEDKQPWTFDLIVGHPKSPAPLDPSYDEGYVGPGNPTPAEDGRVW